MNKLNESYIKQVQKNTGIPKKELENIWKECTEVEMDVSNHPKSSKKFWKGVTQRFENRLDEMSIEEAKVIMSERDALKANIEQFMNHLANDKYSDAKESLPKMLDSSWSILINSRKDSYLRELGNKVQRQAREA